MNKTTNIEASLNVDGGHDLKLGETTLLVIPAPPAPSPTPAEVTTALRKAYRRGRDDETAQTRAVLRGLVGV